MSIDGDTIELSGAASEQQDRLIAAWIQRHNVAMTRSALIVAGSRYSDKKLRRLRAPTHDAEQLAEVLANPEIGGFDVDVLLDKPEHAVRRRLATFFAAATSPAPARATGTPHYSPHGLRRRRGSLHSKRIAADHYVYALTDYREVDRTIALARVTA